jgi:ABC-type Fe3+-hydroxamate transport system substrate-binding protein
MSVGADTYAHDLLALCGGDNVFAGHSERRYPRVTLADVAAAAPEVVLLPDEPYRFAAADAAELAALPIPAARSGRIHVVDGTLLFWYGPRIARALEVVRTLLAPESQPARVERSL